MGLLEGPVQAWELLHSPQASLNTEAVLELARLAGYGEKAAQKMARDRYEARTNQELPP